MNFKMKIVIYNLVFREEIRITWNWVIGRLPLIGVELEVELRHGGGHDDW